MAEGASLSKFVFDSLKQEDKRQGAITINVHESPLGNSSIKRDWKEGCILGEGQNFARKLMETPANLLTPRLFTEKVTERLSRVQSIEVIVRYVVDYIFICNILIQLSLRLSGIFHKKKILPALQYDISGLERKHGLKK